MKGLTIREKTFLSVSLFYIIYIIFPLFADLTHVPEFVPAIVVLNSMYLLYPRAFGNKCIIWGIIYILLLFLCSLLGLPIFVNGVSSTLPYWWRIMIEAAWILPSLSIYVVLSFLDNKKIYQFMGFGALLLLVISFVYILPLMLENYNILREDISNYDIMRPIGLPDYTLMHAYTFIISSLCCCVKLLRGKIRILFVIITVSFLYVIIRTSITTSLIVMLGTVLFVSVYNGYKHMQSMLKLTLLFCTIFFVYYSNVFLSVIDVILPFFEGTAIEFKLNDFRDSLLLGHLTGGSILGRMDYHQISKDAFFSNPIWGSGIAGGHSKFLDLLGFSGLLVFIPFFMTLISFYKDVSGKIFDRNIKAAFVASVIGVFIFLYQKGVFGSAGWLFMTVIVPTLLLGLQSYIKKK